VIRSALLATALMLAPAAARGDEVWSTAIGQVVYEADIGDVAVLAFPTKSRGGGKFYFPGLGGNFDDRGTFEGYWIVDGEGDCPATLTGADGLWSNNWGRAIITFDAKGFPSDWTLLRGSCFDAPAEEIRGES